MKITTQFVFLTKEGTPLEFLQSNNTIRGAACGDPTFFGRSL
ncbi:hypothetical protein [Flavobacterium flevense]|nr:hypothetical protein [Flavobacterium flevense]